MGWKHVVDQWLGCDFSGPGGLKYVVACWLGGGLEVCCGLVAKRLAIKVWWPGGCKVGWAGRWARSVWWPGGCKVGWMYVMALVVERWA